MTAPQTADILPIPNGWFALCWSRELKVGTVMRLHYFDQELALYRSESGKPALLDAYCPHLGAHLAEGGCVIGETLQCPYHGWTFDGSGECVAIPHTRAIPPKARLRSWELVERNQMVFAWHHAEGKNPDWEVPSIEEIGHPDWIDPRRVDIHVSAPVQDLMENHNDPAHFEFVHGIDEMPSAKFDYSEDGRSYRKLGKVHRETPMGSLEISFVTEVYGLGLCTIRTSGPKGIETLALSVMSPIAKSESLMRFLLTVTKKAGESVAEDYLKKLIQTTHEDKRIWENKIYRSNPVLSGSDGYISEFRRWTKQFYSHNQ